MKSYFRSSGYLTEPSITTDSGEILDVSALPSFLRTLLVMDGTVTKSLEAWFWEPVMVEVLGNHKTTAEKSIEALDLEAGNSILRREVGLTGKHSAECYACARSIVALGRLPNNIGQALSDGRIGIGELLREQGFETYRKIFDINYYTKLDSPDSLLAQLSPPIISRSYCISLAGAPAIVVTEYFPVQRYQK